VTQIVICVITFFVGPCGGAIAAYLSKRDSRTGNVEVDEEFAGTCCLVCGVSVPVCSFVAWLGVAIFILTIVIGKSANFDMSWPDLLFGVPIPFRVPSLSLPTALFSFTYGSIRLVLVLGKLSAPCKMLDSLAGFSKIKMEIPTASLTKVAPAPAAGGSEGINVVESVQDKVLADAQRRAEEKADEEAQKKLEKEGALDKIDSVLGLEGEEVEEGKK
jgi:hypothetical protein